MATLFMNAVLLSLLQDSLAPVVPSIQHQILRDDLSMSLLLYKGFRGVDQRLVPALVYRDDPVGLQASITLPLLRPHA